MGVINLGTGNDPTGSIGFSSVVLAVNVPPGALVNVLVSDATSTAVSGAAISDSKGNTYTILQSGAGSSLIGVVYTSTLTVGLISGDTIQYNNLSGSTGSAMSVFQVFGQGSLDINLSAPNGFSSHPSSGSGTPAVVGELVIGAAMFRPTGGAPTQASGYSSPPNSIGGAGGPSGGPGIVAGSIAAATSGSQSYGPTIAAVTTWVAFLFSYQPLLVCPMTNAFVISYRVKRAPVAATSLYYGSQARDVPSAPQIETNTHFIGRLTSPTFRPGALLNYWGQDNSASGPLPLQSERNIHFVSRFTAPNYNVLISLRQNIAADTSTQQDSNTHYVSDPLPWLPNYKAPLTLLRQQTGNDVSTAVVAETNTHFIGKYAQPTYSILVSLRQNVVPPSGLLPTQPETQPHFIGKFITPITNIPRGLYQGQSKDITATAETNTHFIGRYSAPAYNIIVSLRQNVVPPAGPLPTQAETNIHFIAKYVTPSHAIFSLLRQAPAIDVPAAIIISGSSSQTFLRFDDGNWQW